MRNGNGSPYHSMNSSNKSNQHYKMSRANATHLEADVRRWPWKGYIRNDYDLAQ